MSSAAPFDWTSMYLHARSWGVQPSEFWNMTLSEWWAEYDHHNAADTSKFAGNLTQDAVDEILDWMDERKKDGAA